MGWAEDLQTGPKRSPCRRLDREPKPKPTVDGGDLHFASRVLGESQSQLIAGHFPPAEACLHHTVGRLETHRSLSGSRWMTIPRPVPSACSAIQTENTSSTSPEPASRNVSGDPPMHHKQELVSGSGGAGTAQIPSASANLPCQAPA